MKDKIISLETANLALEKGFKKSDLFGKGYTYYVGKNEMWTNVEGGVSGKEETTPIIKCTQSLLQKWLRETHKINIESNYLPNIQKYSCLYIPMKGKATIQDNQYVSNLRFNTYEEALEKGLQKALKLI